MQPIYIRLMVTNTQHYWEKLGFFGGQVFLDFVNTFDDLGKSRHHDALPDWQTALRWSEKSKLLDSVEKNQLTASLSEKVACNELKQLHALRESGWVILHKVAANELPDPLTLTVISKHLQYSYAQSTLTNINNKFRWVISTKTVGAELIRIRLGLYAGQLLSSIDSTRITECGSCTGLFINQGRGIGRKWCRMSTCGNRAKINKFRSGKST